MAPSKRDLTAIASLFLLLTAFVLPVRAQDPRTVTVRSQDSAYFYYRVDTDNRVRLVRQISKNSCVYQQSWGYDYRGVWVDKGCEAEFEIGGGVGPKESSPLNVSADGRREIYLYSPNHQYYKYTINTDNLVELAHHLSQISCLKDRTWGFDVNGVWVDKGCSAAFLIGHKTSGGNNGGRNSAIAGSLVGGVVLASILASRDKKDEPQAAHPAQPGSTERTVYDQSYRYGQQDRASGRSKDYARYRNSFKGGYDDYVKRGYERGYDSRSYSAADSDGDLVPSWLVGSFRGYNSHYNSDVEVTIYSSGVVYLRLIKGTTVTGVYRYGRIEAGDDTFSVMRAKEGFRTNQVGNAGKQVIYTRIF